MGTLTVDEKALGKKLQLARKRAGLTQQELCQKAGLSYSTLAKIERGAIRSPSVFTVASIATATGTILEDLLGAEQNVGSTTPAKKRSKTGVRFVYFDVNGTLVRFHQRGFTAASQELGVPADIIEMLFWRHNDGLCSGRLSLEQFNHTISQELGVDGFDWHKYYIDNVQSMPGMDELVRWVAENYEIGILSNNAPGFIDELKSKGLVPDAEFKAVVDSCKVGAAKPNPKIYEAAQDLAAMEAQEILLIDDTGPFLTAADRAGWQVLWFDEDDPKDSITCIKQHLEF
ncbi:HAD-IA family hydrolase [Candidatus Saccharibacteria bacterium]|nr:HAD-IA family hydrolase [Candidatus Saccharibacteria bacterium]